MNRILNEIKEIIKQNINEYLPEVKSSDLEENGTVYYMNGKNGTEFDWYVNEHLPSFMVFYNDKQNLGAVKLSIYTNGGVALYIYGERGGLKYMEELFKEFEFNESTNYDIKEINGMQLPNDYLEFMHKHNGGEGDVGKNSYMQFIKLEELVDYNNDYEISNHFPNCFAFGGDLGGNHFCYNFTTNEYFAIDCCTTGLEDSYCKATSLYEFIKNWDKQFEGLEEV